MEAALSIREAVAEAVPVKESQRPTQADMTMLQARKMLDRLMAIASAARTVC